MAQVKSALGRDAIILHTRRFKKGGFAGFFGKEMVEVMAAVDQVAASAKEKPTPGEAAAAPPPAKLPAADKGRQPDELQAQVSGMRKLLI